MKQGFEQSCYSIPKNCLGGGKRRDEAIDVMKGIGILAVILGHIQNAPGHALIYSFHMPLFFIIAGYFYKPTINYKAKFLKDVKRLIVPYIVTMAVLFVYVATVHGLVRLDFQQIRLFLFTCLFPSGIKNISNVGSSPLWFLLALFWCRELANLVYTKTGSKGSYVLILLSIASTLIYEYTSFDLPLCIMQAFSALVFYTTGVIIKTYRCKIHTIWVLVACIIWLTLFCFCEIDMRVCKFLPLPLAYLVATCATLSIYLFSKLISKISWHFLVFIPRYLSWAGRMSLVIFCFHSIEKFIPVWNILGIDDNCLILFICKVLFCSVVALICGKLKFTRIVFGIEIAHGILYERTL